MVTERFKQALFVVTFAPSVALSTLAPSRQTYSVPAPSLHAEVADPKSGLFRHAPTKEASERLSAMDTRMEDKKKYQLETQREELAYQRENHDLGMWYLKSLARGLFKKLFGDSRENLHEDHERERSQNKARAEAEREGRGKGRGPASLNGPSEDNSPGAVSRVVTTIAGAVESLTDEGLALDWPSLSAQFRLDPKTTVFETKLHSVILDMAMNYQLELPDPPAPFPGWDRDPSADILALVGSKSFNAIGLAAFVSYQLRREQLGVAVQKQVIGPLYAQVQRSWHFLVGDPESSTAQLNLTVTF